MTYSIIWKPKPLKFLNKLPGQIAQRIWLKIDEIKLNPFRYVEHFEGKNYYKMRIGEYRALLSSDKKEKVIVIELLDKRSRIYKR
jgi:mRNA interferase RelE/StbE